MTTTLAGTAPRARSRSAAPAPTSAWQRRRADRAARRYQEEKRRHDREVHDDRYLDRPGLVLSPTDVAAMWRH